MKANDYDIKKIIAEIPTSKNIKEMVIMPKYYEELRKVTGAF
jgi:hypothetical protein